jgi:hypothetical protein
MATTGGQPLILRGNPTLEEVKGFIREHNRRFHAGIPGGPAGLPAKQIISAAYFESEAELRDLNESGTEIDISDIMSE